MHIGKSLFIVTLLAGAAMAASKPGKKKKDAWKYAGEDHGVCFFFQPQKDGSIRIKVENRLDARVDVLYRVMDTDWKKSFASSLAPLSADSTIRYRPTDLGRDAVKYPYFDQVWLERVDGAASIESGETAAAGPGRS